MTSFKTLFRRYGDLKTIQRHTFTFNGKTFLNGNITLYFTKLKTKLPNKMIQNPTGHHQTSFKLTFNPKINEGLPEIETVEDDEEEMSEEEENPEPQVTHESDKVNIDIKVKEPHTLSTEPKSQTSATSPTIRSFYKKNFVFTKKKFTTGPDRVVTPQTRWKVTAACYSLWYPSRSQEGYGEINKDNAASLFSNIARYSLQKWMFHTTNIEKQQYLEDIFNKYYRHNVETP